MKKLSILIAAAVMILSSTQVFAQGKYGADSATCIQYLSYYKEYYKQKSYAEATPNWRKAFEVCPPTANQTFLVDGTALYRKLITANAKNPIYKAQLVDTLMMIHDLRIQYYPKKAVVARNNKGLDMANYIKDDYQTLFKGYNEIIDSNLEETKAQIFLFDLNAAIELYKVGMLDEEQVIEVYERNSELLSMVKAANPTEQETNDKIKTDLENLFVASKVASCDKLQALFTPRLEADPKNGELAQKIVKIMASAEDCLDNALFIKAATTMYESNPNAGSAYMLYQLNANTGKVDLAIKYINEAINSPELSASEKAQYLYELAVYTYKSDRKAAAIDAARKAVATAEDATLKGKAYLLMGTIWGSVRCEGNEMQTRAPYWVAVDNLELAKKADPSLASEVNNMIAKFRQYYPAAADAFMFDLRDGQEYTVSCGGLRAVTTVKTQK